MCPPPPWPWPSVRGPRSTEASRTPVVQHQTDLVMKHECLDLGLGGYQVLYLPYHVILNLFVSFKKCRSRKKYLSYHPIFALQLLVPEMDPTRSAFKVIQERKTRPLSLPLSQPDFTTLILTGENIDLRAKTDSHEFFLRDRFNSL